MLIWLIGAIALAGSVPLAHLMNQMARIGKFLGRDRHILRVIAWMIELVRFPAPASNSVVKEYFFFSRPKTGCALTLNANLPTGTGRSPI